MKKFIYKSVFEYNDVIDFYNDSIKKIFINKFDNGILIVWKNVFFNKAPTVNVIHHYMKRYFFEINEYEMKHISFVLHELISNAFKSKLDFKFRNSSEKEFKEKYSYKDFIKSLANVSFEVYRDYNKDTIIFIVKNYNEVHEESIRKIEKRLKSRDLSEFSNTFNGNYISYTGGSGIGIFTINNIIKEEFETDLKFYHSKSMFCFYFEISIECLVKSKKEID